MNKIDSTTRLRLKIIKYSALGIFILYSVYLFSIQVVRGYLYSERAQQTQRRIESIEAPRGKIYDRNLTIIADNDYFYKISILLTAHDAQSLSDVVSNLSRVTAISVEDIQARVDAAQAHNELAAEITTTMSLQQISFIVEHVEQFLGVRWELNQYRTYPYNERMAHIVGYVGDISSEELKVLYNRGYDQHSVIGKNGIEQRYDEYLRGENGRKIFRIDALGNEVDVNNIIEPISGYDVITTIDANIQELAWDALGQRIGSVLVMRPQNGEILAMVSYPSYNPNQFYIQNSNKVFKRLAANTQSPFINRAIQSAYAPASTFKILMTSAIIEQNAFDLDRTVFCKGFYELGNTVLYEWNRNVFGHLNLFGGLAHSSNVFFWTVGVEHLGVNAIVDYSHQFGLGRLTGIDLPNEVSGLVPDQEWKQKKFHERWLAGDTANFSIGQGFLTVTPIQMANMVAAISNNGIVYEPHILKTIRDRASGTIIKEYTPKIITELALRDETYELVQDAMREVVTRGTAYSVITTSAVEIAGKTGTGEVVKESDRFHSWFVAFAPHDAPPESQVVIVVLVEAANEWEWWAPKAANIILHGIFANTDYQQAVFELKNSNRGLWYL